jgi:formate hydrogenlyase subunit 6/NADH:ubiquinone oxidoreductase subunit I
MVKKLDTEEKKEITRKKPKKPPKQFPWFMPFTCEGCGDCVDVCPNSCIELLGLDRKVPAAWVIYPDYCIGCGKCADACQCSAVQMTAYVEKAIERYKTKKPFQ